MYHGIEPAKGFALLVTRFTTSEKVMGVIVNVPRIARDIFSYFSVAIDFGLVHVFPRMGTRDASFARLYMIESLPSNVPFNDRTPAV